MAHKESTLCTINIITLLIAISLIVIGIVIRIDSEFTLFTKCLDLGRYHVACWLAIISGFLLFSLPFISCFGIHLQRQYLFLLYCLVSLITISINIATCSSVWRITDREQFHHSLKLEIIEHIKSRYHSPLSYTFIETLQSKLNCCGADSVHDYGSPNLSSCRLDFDASRKGCATSLQNYLQLLSAIIGGLSIVSIFLQLFAIFIWFSGGTVGYKIIES